MHTRPFLFTAMVCALAAPSPAQTKLLRFPDIHGSRVVFSYGSDLWTAPVTGGTAVRLTAHPGLELFAKFSPDGKWIAFTGQYDGDEQVYVMPADGGVPRQLTFYPAAGPLPPRGGYDHQVMGWTPDGASIVFRSFREADGVRSRGALYTVPLAGGPARKLPMPNSGAGDFSPDGKRLVYSPQFRDFRHWKRYQGGWAQDLYVFDLATRQQRRIAASKRTERDPMWIGDQVLFASDRDGTLNLYAVDPAKDQVKQLTFEKTWDVRWPSSDHKGRVVFELNGELRILDVASGTVTPLAITVPTDGGAARPSRIAIEKNIESYSLSPKGERALFVARGDVLTAPIEKGPTRNLTNSSKAHDKGASWSPDGRKIAFVSDLSGEEQVYLMDQDGASKPEILTTTLTTSLTGALRWSPDGKRLALADRAGNVYALGVADRKLQTVHHGEYGRIGDYTWSPDGRFLAFSSRNANGHASLHVWSEAEGKTRAITGDLFSAYEPVWDPEGKYLYFLTDRDFAPQISDLEWNFAGNRRTGISALALRRDVPNPFPPESDEVGGEKKKDAEAGAKAEAPKPAEPLRIDWEGLEQRATRVPVPSDNLRSLEAIKGYLVYAKNGAFFYGRESYAKESLWIFDLKKRKESELAQDIQGYALSGDGQKVLVRQPAGFSLLDVKPDAKDKKALSTKELYADRVPEQEWAEIYDEVWRRYRDYFYVRNMHGYDWKALKEQYRPWLKHVTHRSDLTYVLTELISELNVGHAYVEGGDAFLPERAKVGLPGARLELDEASGRFRLGRIYPGHNDEAKYRSPLTEVGVDVKAGDYVLAIDGVELRAHEDPYRLLRNKTFTVTLTVNGRPSFEGAHQVTYRPVESEAPLRYLDFVLDAKAKAEKLSGGRVGYLHVPDMGAPGIYEFIKWFYPQIRKEGLIVDVRANGGGNVSPMLLERLGRKLLGTRFGSDTEHPTTYPRQVFHGHQAALTNETSASDGDIFPYHYRFAGIGPLIGKRTWGGVVGINNTGPLLDGGGVSVPLSGTNSPTGEWIIEGEGVSPDIEVEDDPALALQGRDPQLERGVQEVLKKIQAEPKALPKRPADPVKTK